MLKYNTDDIDYAFEKVEKDLVHIYKIIDNIDKNQDYFTSDFNRYLVDEIRKDLTNERMTNLSLKYQLKMLNRNIERENIGKEE